MTNEEKQLLLKDLCARFPYKVKVYGNYRYDDGEKIVDDKKIEVLDLSKLDWFLNGIEIKPYLRPMSNMTEDEFKEYNYMDLDGEFGNNPYCKTPNIAAFDWLNAHHFDYRGLIEMGLALEAPENMYN